MFKISVVVFSLYVFVVHAAEPSASELAFLNNKLTYDVNPKAELVDGSDLSENDLILKDRISKKEPPYEMKEVMEAAPSDQEEYIGEDGQEEGIDSDNFDSNDGQAMQDDYDPDLFKDEL